MLQDPISITAIFQLVVSVLQAIVVYHRTRNK